MNRIPTDGSTINVYIDGVDPGHPIYNIYRSDIAALFPGYSNSNGAGGYFSLDTSAYENGVHTIQWTVTDDAGNTDGIGSRYFTIQNFAGSMKQGVDRAPGLNASSTIESSRAPGNISQIPVDYSEPVGVIKGFPGNVKTQQMYPGDNGIITIEIKEFFYVRLLLCNFRQLI